MLTYLARQVKAGTGTHLRVLLTVTLRCCRKDNHSLMVLDLATGIGPPLTRERFRVIDVAQ
jgi:hypothetical protein